jgi:hypothetical protein
LNLRPLIVAMLMALVGCASAPPVLIAESTWRQVDRGIVAASQAATGQTKNYARDAMERWMVLVYQRTDADFIPWFTGYWTQQWLAVKVAWYKLSAGGEKDPVVNRLALYLREQYQDRVLEPVAKEIDPGLIMEQATKLYVRLLGEQLQGLPQRYGVPLAQFEQRLKGIPAIALGPSPTHNVSLYLIVHADPIDRLPAYAALVDRIHSAPGGAGTWSSDAGILSVTKQTSEILATELASRGVSSAVAAVAGGAAGMVISLSAAGFSAIVRESERPETEVRLRQSLNAAFNEEWLDLMWNPDTGVLAGVYYLSGQIEGSLAKTITLPGKFEPVLQGIPIPSELPPHYRNSDDAAPSNSGSADE